MHVYFAVALLLSGAHAANPVTSYERPLNADCVSVNGVLAQLAYITPQTYFLSGSNSANQPGYTTVSFPSSEEALLYPRRDRSLHVAYIYTVER